MGEEHKSDVIDRLLETASQAMRVGLSEHIPPGTLYHFTDAAGAVGILTSGKLWASRAMSMNDSLEVEYGIKTTRRYLRQRLDQETRPKRRVFLESVLEWLIPGTAPAELVIKFDHFVFSLCEDVGRSVHWLHYGRAGSGYALAIDTAALPLPGFDLAKVIYDVDQQNSLVGQAVSLLEERFLDLGMVSDNALLAKVGGVAAHLCATVIRVLSARLKHPSFRSEEEWRLITMDMDGLTNGVQLESGYRANGSRIVPYLIAPLPCPLPISEIVVGQAVSLMDVKGAIDYLFREKRLGKPPPIRQTEVPVR